MSRYYERLAELCSEYASHLRTQKWSGLRNAPERTNDVTDRELSSKPFSEKKPPIVAAVDWWEENGEDKEDDPRVLTLHALLRELDRRLRPSELVITQETPSGRLFIGRRWWERYRSHVANTPDDYVPTGDFLPPLPLHNLRLLQGELPRWLRSHGLGERAKRVLNQRGSLRVGACVLGRNAHTRFEDTGAVDQSVRARGFRAGEVEWIAGEGSIAGELAECVAWAEREGIHVLCFPELSISPADRAALRAEIEAKPGDLCVVVPGSFHEPVTDRHVGWVNRAPVWTLFDGEEAGLEELGAFEKIEAFTMPAGHAKDTIRNFDSTAGEYREHVDLGELLTLVPTPVGVIGIAICRDLLKPDIVERYALAADHLLIISMNDGETNGFWSASDLLARTGPTASYYVNSTQFVAPGNQFVDLAYSWFPRGTLEGKPTAYFHDAPARLRGHMRTETISPEFRVVVSIPLPGEIVEQ